MSDEVVLETVKGAASFLLADLHAVRASEAQVLTRGDDALSLAFRGPLAELADIRPYSSCGVLLAPIEAAAAPSLEQIARRLDESLAGGVLSALRPAEGRLHFRVSPLRYGRWEIRDFLVDRYGWVNDPGEWDVNVEAHAPWLIAQVGALHHAQRFPALVRIPASTNPIVSSVMVRLLETKPGETVHDPFCGAGTLLVEVLETVPGSRVVGSDTEARAIDAARRNLERFPGRYELRRADARHLRAADDSVARVIGNLPFGKRVGSHQKNVVLYPDSCAELARVLSADGRAVLLTEEKQLLRRAVGATGRLQIVREHLFETGGLHPSAFVLARAGRPALPPHGPARGSQAGARRSRPGPARRRRAGGSTGAPSSSAPRDPEGR